MSAQSRQYVSRAGIKLQAALDAFKLDVTGFVCADFGSHVGGFVDCLLRHGAARIHAVEPGFGVLDYKLRCDPRVVLHERTNALRFDCPEPCDLVTIDVGWTPQRLILLAAKRALKPDGRVVSLVKPQYEAAKSWLKGGVLHAERQSEVLDLCRRDVRDLGWKISGECPSPLAGHGGNAEWLWLLVL